MGGCTDITTPRECRLFQCDYEVFGGSYSDPFICGDQRPTALNSLGVHIYYRAILATIMQVVFWFKSQLCHSSHYVTQFPLR